LDRGEGDEGLERRCEVFPVLGKSPISAEPREGSLDDPATRQHSEAFYGVAAFDDFDAKRRNLGDGRVDLVGVASQGKLLWILSSTSAAPSRSCTPAE